MNDRSSDISAQYVIAYEDRGDYLYAFVTGAKDSIAVSLSFWRELAAESKARQVAALLVEEDFRETLSVGEMFELVEGILALDWHSVRVAFVDCNEAHHELNEFGEVVATNRGMRARVFTDVVLAETWLRG